MDFLRSTPPLALATALALATTLVEGAEPRSAPRRPVIIAHRGASGYRPEHTLAAYDLAIDQGADFIEPDLVSTRDGRLVARHENEISQTTDVAQHPEFADRKTTKSPGGRAVTGWFTEDFTLAELKTLRAVERLPRLRPASAQFDGQFEIPTLEEVVQLARRRSAERKRTIGIYPETKHAAYFESLDLALEPRVVEILEQQGWTGPEAPVFLQSFEPQSLRKLQTLSRVRRIQLLGDRPPAGLDARSAGAPGALWITPEILARIREYADGIGPDKSLIVPRDREGVWQEPTSLVADAHAAGLLVHPYTFRSENQFLPPALRLGTGTPGQPGDHAAEYELFFRLGVDGLFSDHPDAAVAARNRWLAR